MPWQQFGQARERQVRDPGDDVGEPGLRVDPVQLGGADQGVHEGRALPAALGTGEEPGFSAQGDTAQGAFRRVVGEADPAIVEEPGEAGPVFGRERIVDGFGDLGMLRELCPLRPKPELQGRDQRGRARLSGFQTGGGVETGDLALDVEERIDALHRLEGDRRDFPGILALADVPLDIRQFKELAPRVAPAQSRKNRPRRAIAAAEVVVAGTTDTQ